MSAVELWLAFLAGPALLASAISIRSLGLRRTLDLGDRFLSRPINTPRAISPANIVGAVAVLAARLPATACVERSVTARLFLRRRGHDAVLILGAPAGGIARDFRAHAWVEVDGVPIGEASDLLTTYVRLGDPLGKTR